MDAALAQGALERLSESAAGFVGGSKPKLFRASALVTSRDSGGGRRPTLHDAPHGLFQQSILILLRSVGAEQQNVRDVTPSQFLAQELVDVVVGDFAGFSCTVEQVDDALLLRRQCGERTFELIRPARWRTQQALGQRIVAVDLGEEALDRLKRLRSASAAGLSKIVQRHPEIRAFGFGYFGLNAWGNAETEVILRDRSASERAVRRSEFPISFSALCDLFSVDPADVRAGVLWKAARDRRTYVARRTDLDRILSSYTNRSH